MNRIKAITRIRVEHDVNLVIKKLKLKFFGQPHDEVLLTTDRKYKHYIVNEDRIVPKDSLRLRKY